MHPAVKRAFHTHHRIYRWWFPCRIGWNNDKSSIRLKLETTTWKLLPFYICTWGLLFGIGFGSMVFLLIRELFQPSSRLTAIHLGIYFAASVLTLLSWGVGLVFHSFWEEIVAAFNQLVAFEEDWRRRFIVVKLYTKIIYGQPRKQNFQIHRPNSEHITGIFLNVFMIGGGVVAAPIVIIFGIGTNLDPFLPILEDYFLPPPPQRSDLLVYTVLFIRALIAFLAIIEFCRAFFLLLLLTCSLGETIKNLLRMILETEGTDEAYHKVQLLWLQFYIIKTPFNNVLAIGSIIGFFGGTALIWLSFNSWNHVTPFIASLFPILSFCILVILLVGISTQVSIVEKSNLFIYKWKQESLLCKTGMHIRKDTRLSKMLGRTLRCLPVACSSCCGINSSTPFSFLQILMKAVTDSLLGIKI
ncbi:unnamed protein product [Orchesella dallaii]|uniref:Odorant receptor n=1 Tax=Orchesella dallaii TaxID=48710 RepID=A0ABP1R2Z4_9HEXA